jgi:hypothetical protein
MGVVLGSTPYRLLSLSSVGPAAGQSADPTVAGGPLKMSRIPRRFTFDQ